MSLSIQTNQWWSTKNPDKKSILPTTGLGPFWKRPSLSFASWELTLMHHGQRFSDENAFQLDAAAAVVYTSFSYLSNVSLCISPPRPPLLRLHFPLYYLTFHEFWMHHSWLSAKLSKVFNTQRDPQSKPDFEDFFSNGIPLTWLLVWLMLLESVCVCNTSTFLFPYFAAEWRPLLIFVLCWLCQLFIHK